MTHLPSSMDREKPAHDEAVVVWCWDADEYGQSYKNSKDENHSIEGRWLPAPAYAALVAERDRLREALVGLVGSNDPAELSAMLATLPSLPMTYEYRKNTSAAIRALLGDAR